MAGRRPARFLAPLALVAVVVALFLVVTASPDDDRAVTPATSARQANGTQSTGADGKKQRKRRLRRRYTVKPGDTPSGIAEKTGVPLEEILSLNPDLDPQTLAPGAKLRLRR
jgi:LysM repeat protein